MSHRLFAAGLCLAAWSVPSVTRAESPPGCASVDRRSLVACTLAQSPELRSELAAQRAVSGRREAARPFLPSNPQLSGTVASRWSPAGSALNFGAQLSQELEIAGQSGARVAAADLELAAQAQRLEAAKRSIAERAWRSYFKTVAAEERAELGVRLAAASQTVAETVRAMAAGGLSSELEAEVAEAAALKSARERLQLEGAAKGARSELELLAAAALSGTPSLEPLAVTAAEPRELPEVLALREEARAFNRRADVYRREQVPNPTLSVAYQRDGFDENLFGGGLSLPIPLPQPLGRTRAGEIREAEALAERAGAEADRAAREQRLELASARAELEAAQKSSALYTAERSRRATARLGAISAQVKAGRLSVRDALAGQEALFEQLKADIDAKERLCLASVRLARALGLSLEGDAL